MYLLYLLLVFINEMFVVNTYFKVLFLEQTPSADEGRKMWLKALEEIS